MFFYNGCFARMLSGPVLACRPHINQGEKQVRTVHYGEVTVDFTDGEYQRLQAIKQERYDNPDWTPPPKYSKGNNKVVTNINISATLRDRAKAYAKEKGISLSRLISDLLEVITA